MRTAGAVWLSALIAACGMFGCADRVADTLEAYDQLREALATSRVGDVATQADLLSQRARLGVQSADDKQRYHLQELAGAAQQPSQNQANAEGTVRLATARHDFQEVSRHVVALLEAEPERQTQYQLLECATLEGYNRWVQPKSDGRSPYEEKPGVSCVKLASWGAGHCPFDYF